MEPHVSQRYLVQQLAAASPARLVAMLLDQAIVKLNEAIAAIEAGDIERRWRANSRATEIIAHLWETLNVEQGAGVAEKLQQLYGYMLRRLSVVDLDNDARAARDVVRLLEPLRQSWQSLAAEQERSERARGEAAPEAVGKVSLSA